MPMIEFRYGKKISDEQAVAIGGKLECALRNAIIALGRSKKDYGVTVEGDPFGPITHGQPDLRIYVFYHDDWDFTAKERDALPVELRTEVQLLLEQCKVVDVVVKIRCYCRSGPPSATVTRDSDGQFN